MNKKRVLIYIFLMLSSVLIKDSAYSDDDLSCITPVLTSKFGVISTIKGVVMRDNNDKRKVPEKHIYLKVKEVNGQNRNVTLKCIGFDKSIAEALSEVKSGRIIEVKGYESIISGGQPHNMIAYLDLMRTDTNYHITNIIVVVSGP